MEQDIITKSEQKKACSNCGGELRYSPGTHEIECPYCNHKEEIIQFQYHVAELDLHSYLEQLGEVSHSQKISILSCKSCGANQHVEENYKSLHCIYCSEPLIKEDSHEEDWIVPGGLVPFQYESIQAQTILKKWVKSLWFAPNSLKKASISPDKIKGLYLPYWTFDAQLYANYTGKRGEHYYDTESYTDYEDGKAVRKTRRVRKTRWYSAYGEVSGFVDDVLISASEEQAKLIPAAVSRWNWDALVPFNSNYLSGFITEKYTISLEDGFQHAYYKMEGIASSWARRDIGGDEQRVYSIDMTLSEETFKHVLLPLYISNYTYKDKKYHFYVNGQTGAISGSRPYSFWKIFFTVLTVILIFLLLYILSECNNI